MQAHHLLTVATVTLLSPAALAFAETGSRQDNSHILVWAFLGMCALIVIIQLMPVVMLTYGLVKGLLKGKAETAAKEVTVHK